MFVLTKFFKAGTIAAILSTVALAPHAEAFTLDWTNIKNQVDWRAKSNNKALTYQGSMNGLTGVYYHPESKLYIRTSATQKWGWGGSNESNDSYPYSPKVVNGSRWGNGGFDGQDTFLYSMNTHEAQGNVLTLEFFKDQQLTQKANVSALNFTLTDLDGKGNNKNREYIVISARDASGGKVLIDFFKPRGSRIQDSFITHDRERSTSSVRAFDGNISDASGNIAPVFKGDVHKVTVDFSIVPGTKDDRSERHMYVTDLAWGGDTIFVTGSDKVQLDDHD